MVYARSFFDLQLRFADHVATISRLPLEHILLDYTNLYIRFGLGRDYQPSHPVWQAYLAGLREGGDIREWTYRFYRTRDESTTGPPIIAAFGCFSYALVGDDSIRLHFNNADTGSHSSLAAACIDQRRADLTAIFRHIRRTPVKPRQVVGVSWLYNLQAYRRLFPESYTAAARAIGNRLQGMSLWGQFLDRHGEVKESMARPFLARLELHTRMEHLVECFPFQVMTVEAPVEDFYDHYGL